ncbi:hypothetical protein EXE25_15385 [Acinetobacter bouvetii]|jgi:hypothetical protein|uniref:Lipoprotein n=1 Tax=Acinetobacter bouvetii TaxID=202951 RepID=A0A4Q7ATJ6_9GAMM|nr:hypothetical protein [Acinetobacter bouvetii]RZG64952.1 hypothetical protein EXE25_15385 [Acinetobacter bouvetii]
MKSLAIFATAVVLAGCSISASRDIKKAEKLLNSFHCSNIESSQMAHSPITSYHEQLLHSAKQKAENYIESYKNGETLFDIPLSAVVEQQYDIYKDACQNLGGISQEPEQESTP